MVASSSTRSTRAGSEFISVYRRETHSSPCAVDLSTNGEPHCSKPLLTRSQGEPGGIIADRVAGNECGGALHRGPMIQVFEAGDPFVPEELPRGCRVAVKPNLTFPTHRPGVTTSPAVLRTVVQLLVERSNQVFVVESDGGYGAWDCERA